MQLGVVGRAGAQARKARLEGVDQGRDLAQLDFEQVHLQHLLVALVELVAAQAQAHRRLRLAPLGALARQARRVRGLPAATRASTRGRGRGGRREQMQRVVCKGVGLAWPQRLPARAEQGVEHAQDVRQQRRQREEQHRVVAARAQGAVERAVAQRHDGPVLRQRPVKGKALVGGRRGAQRRELGQDQLLAAARGRRRAVVDWDVDWVLMVRMGLAVVCMVELERCRRRRRRRRLVLVVLVVLRRREQRHAGHDVIKVVVKGGQAQRVDVGRGREVALGPGVGGGAGGGSGSGLGGGGVGGGGRRVQLGMRLASRRPQRDAVHAQHIAAVAATAAGPLLGALDLGRIARVARVAQAGPRLRGVHEGNRESSGQRAMLPGTGYLYGNAISTVEAAFK